MALIPVSVSPYPNVPDLPGVPAVARLVGANLPLPVLELSDLLGLSFGQPQWGIFSTSGTPVLVVDSVIDVSVAAEVDVPTYRVEQGAFQSYNKVQLPNTHKVTMTCGGSNAKRQAFLSTLETIKLSLQPYSVVTPEYTYASVTITRYEIMRSAVNGVSLITAEVYLSEIRVTATASTVQTVSPNGAASQSTGTVQTIPVTATQLPPITAAGAT